MIIANELLPIVLSGFLLAVLVAFLHRLLGRAIGWVVALLPLSIATYFVAQLGTIGSGGRLIAVYDWVPSLNIQLSFFADGLSVLMALIVTGVGTLIMIYGGGYLAGDKNIGRFYVIILAFMAAMLGVVLSDNIFLLFLFWELTSITSYLLIGFKHEYESSRDAARQALLVTGSGGLALLAGLILLGLIGGSWDLSVLLVQDGGITADPLYLPALILILLGAFTKSAQFPFHFWLPNAMAAPTPVSAYLHSATMVKAGVYLLARLSPVLGGTAPWFVAVTVVGAVTAIMGAWLSWQKTDLKQILAYSTVSALGTMVMLLGMGSALAAETAVLFLLVHSLYKGGLFMAAGAIDHETGTREVARLGGLARLMPFTLGGVLLAALSMAGLPPLLGFISKELMYEATLEIGRWSLPLTAVTLATNVFMVAAASIVLLVPFFGPVTDDTAQPHHRAPLSMWLGPMVLGVLALLAGLFSKSELVAKNLVSAAATAVSAHTVEAKLGLWHGLTPMLALSGVTVTLGVIIYLLHRRLRPGVQRLDMAVARIGPEQWYERGLAGLLEFARVCTALVQNGYLRYYIVFVLGTAVLLIGGAIFRASALTRPIVTTPISFYQAAISLAIIIGAFIVVRARSRLFAVAGLGVVGFGIALIYIFFSAPDLAMTQFSIETLTVILLVLVLFRLPRFETISTNFSRVRDAVLSIMVGTMMALLVLIVKGITVSSPITDYYARSSYLLAEGRNIVNVILVDFRGTDTMVEITVLTVAAIGVYGLMQSRKTQNESQDAADQEAREAQHSSGVDRQ